VPPKQEKEKKKNNKKEKKNTIKLLVFCFVSGMAAAGEKSV